MDWNTWLLSPFPSIGCISISAPWSVMLRLQGEWKRKVGTPPVHFINLQCAWGDGRRKREGNTEKVKKSVKIREGVVSCLKGRNGFLIATKSFGLQPLGAWAVQGSGTYSCHIGRNVCPGHLPGFPRCLGICWNSANCDDLPAEVVVIAETGMSWWLLEQGTVPKGLAQCGTQNEVEMLYTRWERLRWHFPHIDKCLLCRNSLLCKVMV